MNEAESKPLTDEDIFLEKIQTIVTEAILQGKPLEFDLQDVENLKRALQEAGVQTEVSEEERGSLLEGTQLRLKPNLKVEEVEGFLLYDWTRPKGQRWVQPETVAKEYYIHKDRETDKEILDRSLGVMAMLGTDRFSSLVEKCWNAAREEGWGRIVQVIKDEETGEVIDRLPREGTEGRGLQQAAADILSAGILDPDSSDFESNLRQITDRLNRRLWKGLKRVHKGREVLLKRIDERFEALGLDGPTRKLASFPPHRLPDITQVLFEAE